MFLNLKEKGILKTVNFNNIVEQLNDITKVIEGSSSGNISDIQLENINTNINKIKEKLNLLETDVTKYIDEGELENALKGIKLSLNDIVKTNDLNNAVNKLTTSISNLLHKIELLEQREVVDTTEFVKKDELNTKVENSIKSSIDKIETKFLENSKDIIKNNVNDKINELVGNIDTKINDKVTEKLNLEIKNINKSIDEKTKDNVSQNDLNKELKDYAKLNEDNLFTRKITGKEIKSNSIETNELKVGGKNVVTDTSNFAKLNTTNDFTQKIKGTEIESNKLITNELLLNGINVNLSDYSTNNNVIKQIEKVVGLAYDGNIEDVKNKIKGKFYFNSINNYFYECIVDNNLTYIDNSKFRPISNKPISNRIDNLINIKKINIDKVNYIGNHQLHPKTFLIGVHINADAQLGNGKLSSIKWFPRINGDWYASQIFSNFTNSEGFKININENNVNITYFDVANSGTRLIALYELYIN